MIIDKEGLDSLIPHKGKMLLLSGVREYNLEERSLCAEYNITEDCLFFDPATGAVPAWAGFEFMAQAISLLSGIRGRIMGVEPRIGFIMSVSSMQIAVPSFKTGSIVEVKVKEKNSLDLVYNFTGEIFLEGRKVMEGNLTVMDASDEQIEIIKKENIQIE